MALDERARDELLGILDAAIGSRGATLLMTAVQPFEWSELATKSDLAALRSELRGEMTELRSELRGEMTELRSELRAEMAGLRGEMTEVRSGVQGQLVGLHAEMRLVESRIGDKLAALRSQLFYANVGAMLGFGGLVLAAVAIS